MGLIATLLGERRALEKTFVDNPAEWLVQMFGGRSSATGIPVNETSALQSSAVFSSVAGLSETMGSLPLFVYRRLDGGGKEPDPSHSLFEPLHLAPNPEISTMVWREMSQAQAMFHGNTYTEIVRDGRGRVKELWPIPSIRIRLERRGPAQALTYLVTVPGGTLSVPNQAMRRSEVVPLAPEQVLHVRGLSLDGVTGVSRLMLHRESIGLTLALEEFGARFFGNNAIPGGVLEHPTRIGGGGTAGTETLKRLRAQFEELHRGLDKSHRIAVLEEGMKFHEISMQNERAQFLQSRQFQVGETGRIFRMPGVMIGHDDKTATYASAEQFFLAYVVHTVRPWAVRWDQALTLSLLTPTERRTHFVEHKIDGLLRGDVQSRYAAYAIGRQWGWLSADDVRELENLNPLPNGEGKIYNRTGSPVTPPATTTDAERALLEELVGRLVRREVTALRKAVERHADVTGLAAWSVGFYREHIGVIVETLTPWLKAHGIPEEAAAVLASHHAQQSLRGFSEAVGQNRAATEAWLAALEADRPTQWSAALLRSATICKGG